MFSLTCRSVLLEEATQSTELALSAGLANPTDIVQKRYEMSAGLAYILKY
jgi:hypothetical protein